MTPNLIMGWQKQHVTVGDSPPYMPQIYVYITIFALTRNPSNDEDDRVGLWGENLSLITELGVDTALRSQEYLYMYTCASYCFAPLFGDSASSLRFLH